MINKTQYFKFLTATALVVTTGCASNPRHIWVPEPRPLGATYHSAGSIPESLRGPVVQAPGDPVEALRLPDAIALALSRNPVLISLAHQSYGADAQAVQAGRLPNPELELEMEEYDRGGAGVNSSESIISIGQPLELGRKRHWRQRVAEAKLELAGWDYEAARLDIYAETSRRFVDVLAAQQCLALSQSAVTIAEQTAQAVGARVAAGTEPQLQATKATAGLELARLDVLDAESELKSARRHLSNLWASDQPHFETVSGGLESVAADVPVLSDLRRHLPATPEIARWDAELRLRRANLAKEKAARIPNIHASVGWQNYEEDGTDAFAFGVAGDLPLFDRNQGNIGAALHELKSVQLRQQEADITLSTRLSDAHSRLTLSRQRARAVRTKIVPAMQEAFESASEGYRQGKFSFLDMLDAQRELLKAKGEQIEALAAYQTAMIEIERITATPLRIKE